MQTQDISSGVDGPTVTSSPSRRVSSEGSIIVKNDQHEWVDSSYVHVGDPEICIDHTEPDYMEWAETHDVCIGMNARTTPPIAGITATPQQKLLVWVAVTKPYGSWEDTSNPVRTTLSLEALGNDRVNGLSIPWVAKVQQNYTIGKWGTADCSSIRYIKPSGQMQFVTITEVSQGTEFQKQV